MIKSKFTMALFSFINDMDVEVRETPAQKFYSMHDKYHSFFKSNTLWIKVFDNNVVLGDKNLLILNPLNIGIDGFKAM